MHDAFFEAIIASPFPAPEVLAQAGVTLFGRRPGEGEADLRHQASTSDSDLKPWSVHLEFPDSRFEFDD